MINRKACPILLVFSTMIIFCFYVPKVYTAEVSTTFWEEPQKKWNEYLAAMSKYECSMREQIQWPTEKRDHSIEVIGQYPQFISTVSSADNQEIVLGFNTKYSFKIHRDKASTSDWIVDTLEPFSADMVFQTLSFESSDFSSRVLPNRNIRDVMCGGLRIRIYWLPDLIKLKEFKTLACDFSEENNLRIATIKFSIQSNPPLKDCDVRSGTLVLLPDHYWQILRGQCILSDGSLQNNEVGSIINTYTLRDGTVPLLEQSMEEGKAANGSSVLKVTRDYSRYEETMDVTDSRFTLTHYGLPEPDFGERRVNRFRYILIGTGLLLISIALWQMYQKRKEQQK